ncbi:SRPBCC domain-containing protein [Chitinophaga sp. XS-30]|uniref:SRPBCC family protein n=1 Tax=Chitinophaga sp. XS-30 TaxID=2604421 RepID=UPI0011DDAC6C|nr:SRPBCC domain-containing protein [Chitinophaga sp. XS-30]QEH42899.1 SRPBCC domain-containing protein [Chitinophaga sp. XS-30]
MNKAPFVIERTLDAAADTVWQAITNRDQMKEWYFDIAAFQPVVGFEFQFSGGSEAETYVHLCRVTAVEPGRKLAYTWKYQNYPGESEVTFELFPEGNKTRLKLTHTGLETFPANKPDFAKESFAAGWTDIIGNLLPNYLAGKK